METNREVARRAETVPHNAKTLYLGAGCGEVSPRKAIKAKCQECMGYEDYRVRIMECPVRTCPLWQYRPYRPKK